MELNNWSVINLLSVVIVRRAELSRSSRKKVDFYPFPLGIDTKELESLPTRMYTATALFEEPDFWRDHSCGSAMITFFF